MKSDLPKVLIPLLEKPMVQWVVDALREAGVESHCLIIGGEIERFDQVVGANKDITVCIQNQRRGTGDAVASAYPGFETDVPPADFLDATLKSGSKIRAEYVLVCTGDTPNLRPDILREFSKAAVEANADISVLGMKVPDPTGYGRIVLDESGSFGAIIEERDASAEQKKITLCNSGVFIAKTDILFDLIRGLSTDNNQEEYYLTDCIAIAKNRGLSSYVHETKNYQYFLGINTPEQLEYLSEIIRS